LELFTQLMNCNESLFHLIKGYQLRKRPIAKMMSVLFIIFLQKAASPASLSRGITKLMALPTANKKKGKTRSVGVRPCHLACANGLKI